MGSKLKLTSVCVVGWFTTLCAAAQLPQDLPHQTDPIDFTKPGNVLFYIGLPLLMIVVYVLLRKRARRKRKGE